MGLGFHQQTYKELCLHSGSQCSNLNHSAWQLYLGISKNMILWDYGSSATLLASPRQCVWRCHCKSSAPCSLQGKSQPWWEHYILSHFAKNRKNMGDPFTCQEEWCDWGSCCCLWQGSVSHHYTPDQWNAYFATIFLSAFNLKALFHNTRGHVLDPIQFFSLFSPLKHPALNNMVCYHLFVFNVSKWSITSTQASCLSSHLLVIFAEVSDCPASGKTLLPMHLKNIKWLKNPLFVSSWL